MIRVGVHLSPGSTVWIKPHKFDYSDFTFSPPSVSVTWKDDSLSVKVKFPCAANRRCSRDGCCPVSKLIDPWTTVTVYNELNLSENQSRTVWTQEDVSTVEFSALSLDQNYCAVANFSFPTFSMAASPKSAPQCVETVPNSGMLHMLCLGIGLASLFLLLLLTVFLRKPRRATPQPENQPKTLNDSISLVSTTLVPVDPCDIHLEFADDHTSSESYSSFHPSPNQTSIVGNLSLSDPVQYGPTAGADYWDSGGPERERGLESCIIIPHLSHASEETCRTNED
ncbi:uncharacterized protein LOC121639381 [Melanotaenia boesemani]|uniref:uncharacterized protein LOC121639381 n=1 Tax=Melanotaenia boesemani TaxID=1250792 RepID=UPI001C0533A4|nr:uncharacterized protein LOC121639381 [Melanotaenia boesemani]